jgi:hypothetical protein
MSIQPTAMDELTDVAGGMSRNLCRAGWSALGAINGAATGAYAAKSDGLYMLNATSGFANASLDSLEGKPGAAFLASAATMAPLLGPTSGAVGGAYIGGRGMWRLSDALCKK